MNSKLNLHPKVGAAAAGANVSVIVLWLLDKVVVIPSPVQLAVGGLIVALCAWAAPTIERTAK